MVLPGLVINRLSKWAVASENTIRVNLSPQSSDVAVTAEGHSLRLELDISTAADYSGNLNEDQLADLFQELARLAEEITINGDKA